jgi:hypothetical protein
MNKTDITKSLVSKDDFLNADPKALEFMYRTWWANWRSGEDRRFRLTDQGYAYFRDRADIKFYDIRFPRNLVLTNKMIIDLDRFIDCPYYVENNCIKVTGEKVAVQLVLFDGDLARFGQAKRETKKRKAQST